MTRRQNEKLLDALDVAIPPKLRPLTRLTLPLLSMMNVAILTCQVLDEPVGDAMTLAPGAKSRDITTVRVMDLSSNMECALVVNAQIAQAFRSLNGALKGRYFQLRSTTIFDGRSMTDISVTEMEVEE
jgi:hypothetical protein